jgi:FMN reductase (NADPH)
MFSRPGNGTDMLPRMNDAIDLMMRHRSIRRYRPDPIPESHIRIAVEAGQAASTSSAEQIYCLIRVTDQAHRRHLVELTGGQEKVARCGAFFIVCGDTRRLRLAIERSGRTYAARLEGFLKAVIDASLFAQNLALAFESLGYGICYIGGLRNDLPAVDRLLELPGGVYPLFGLCVGVPEEQPIARPRLPIEAVLFDGRYPSDEAMVGLIAAYDGRYRDDLLAARVSAGPAWSEVVAVRLPVPQPPEWAVRRPLRAACA